MSFDNGGLMEELTDRRWLTWNSTEQALDAELVMFMDNEEKFKAIGKPIYAMMQRGMPIGYPAFYLTMCVGLYPKWMIDRTLKFYEKHYEGLTTEFLERL